MFLKYKGIKQQKRSKNKSIIEINKAVNFPEETKIFINESLCPYYRGLWNKCKKLRDKQKVYQYYTINELICLRSEESGQAKTITHMGDLQNLFPDTDIDSL